MLTNIKKKLTLVIDLDNKEIIRGASTTFGLKISGIILSYVFNIVFARLYGPRIMGIYALAITMLSIFTVVAQMGTQTSIVRFISQFAIKQKFIAIKKTYKYIIKLIFPFSIILSILFYFISPYLAYSLFNKPLLIKPLQLMALILPLNVFVNVNAGALRGLKKIKKAFIFSTIFPPLFRIFGLVFLSYFVLKNYIVPIYANILSILVGVVYSTYLWVKETIYFPREDKKITEKVINFNEIIKVSLPMFITSTMLLVMGLIDIFMLGILSTSYEVGVYRIALKLSLFTSFTLSAVNSIAAPKFSELYWNGDNKKLKYVTKFSSKIIFFTSFPVFIIILFYGKFLLSVFGTAFVAGYTALVILSSGQLINASCGPIGTLMNMVGKQKEFMIITVISVIINIILNYILILKFQSIGAAIATTISTIIINISTSFVVYKNFGYWVGYPSIR